MPPKVRRKDKEAQNSSTCDAVLAKENTRLEQAMKDSQNEEKVFYPPLTQWSFDKLKRNRDSLRPEFWSDADEAQVRAQGDLDSAARPFRPRHPKEPSIWKTSARFLACLQPSINEAMLFPYEDDSSDSDQDMVPVDTGLTFLLREHVSLPATTSEANALHRSHAPPPPGARATE